jgi:hypothetical protein
MSIDKGTDPPPSGRRIRIPAGQFLFHLSLYLVRVTPLVMLPLLILAVELGVFIRVFKEAFNWGFDLLGF